MEEGSKILTPKSIIICISIEFIPYWNNGPDVTKTSMSSEESSYAGIKHSDWLKIVTGLGKTNQNA